MKNNVLIKKIMILSVIVVLSMSTILSPASALTSQNSTSWYWTSDTRIGGVTVGDVDGDGAVETVTVGHYNDGANWYGQLVVWDSATLVPERFRDWRWGQDTSVSGVAVGDVDSDGIAEIITVGTYYDGTRYIAMLVVWDGVTLNPQVYRDWLWGQNTNAIAVAVGDFGSGTSIVTVGAYNNGDNNWIAMMVVWNGNTLVPERYRDWQWGQSTDATSVVVGNFAGDASLEIATLGTYSNGVNSIPMLVVWNGNTLAPVSYRDWLWGQDNVGNSLAAGDVDGDGAVEFVTGGSYYDNSRFNGQLVVWDAATLAAERFMGWQSGQITQVFAVAVGDFGSGTSIVTVGAYNDGTRNNAQLIHWSGATLAMNDAASWYIVSDTISNAVTIADTGAGNHIIVGGEYWDNTRTNAQITVWG